MQNGGDLMTRLPIPGKDDGTWGNVLNDFLKVEHNDDGSLKTSGSLAAKADDSAVVHITGDQTIGGTKTFSDSPIVPDPTIGTQAASKAYVDGIATSGAPDADSLTKGILQLTGDLTGTATDPQIAPGVIINADISASAAIAQSKIANLIADLSAKQDADADLSAIASLTPVNNDILQRKSGAWTNRTPAQVKTDLALVKADVGLGNVDNTSDASKPISTATQTALDLKVDETISVAGATSLTGGGALTTNRTISLVNDAASPGNDRYYGTNGTGTKGYHALPVADPVLGGDLTGTASNAQLAAGAIVNADISASAAIAQSKIANLTTDLAAKADDSTTITGTNSISGGGSLAANRTLSLVNDAASPGNSKYYGTNGTGTRGFYDVPVSGETNTASNVGIGGVGVFKQKTGTNLEFKNINAASNKVSVTNDGPNNEIDIGVNEANFTNIPQSAVTNLTSDLSAKADDATTITGANSLAGGGSLAADRTLTLVNDVASPGNSKYYGTNGAGARGFFDVPATGEINTASNVGAGGVGVFKQKVGTTLQLKTLNAGSSKIVVTDDTADDEIEIDINEANLTNIPQSAVTNLTSNLAAKADDATTITGTNSIAGGGSLAADRTLSLVNDAASPGTDRYYGTDGSGAKGYFALPVVSGEANTASNVGAGGVGIFKQKSGVDFEFKNINAASNKVTVTNDGPNDEIDIDVDEANFTNIPQSAVTSLTSDLAAKADDSALTAHTSDSTNVHGIPDTALLVYSPDIADMVTSTQTDASGFGFVIDEDDFTSNSNTRVPTQQSVKAYVDATAGGAVPLDTLSDVTISSPANGQVLKYNGTGWVNGADDTGGGGGGGGADLIGTGISVRDEGALGDGATNDTAAIQAAITTAGANGTVVFPAGVYMIDTITAVDGQRWVGLGEAVLKLNSASSYVNLFNRSNMTFTNLTFDGNNFIGAANGYAVAVGTTTNMRFERCHFKDVYGSAINGGNTVRLRVINCSFTDIGAWDIDGPIADNHAEGAAVYATAATDIVVEGNLIRRTLCDGAIFISNASGAYVANNTILDTFYGGVQMYASAGASTMTGVQVIGNHLERIGSINTTANGIGANGIYLRGAVTAEDMVAEGNFIKNVCENGIEASTRPATIRNNTIITTGAYTSVTTPSTEGIWAFNGSIVEGNTISDTDLEGIYYFSTGAISNTVIRDNNIRDAGRQTKNALGPDRTGAVTLHSSQAAASSISNVWVTGTRIVNSGTQMTFSVRLRATGAGGTVDRSCRVEDTIERGGAMTRDVGAATTNPYLTTGTGTPEGAVTAPIGSLYTRIDGGASTTLYIKESGTGNTGWIAK